MNQSELVEKLKEKYTNEQIKLYSAESPRKVGQPDEKLVTRAYVQICDMWNSNDKSRGFIKYLIRNFVPVNNNSRVMEYPEEEVANDKNRCCILRIKLANAEEIVDYFSKVSIAKLRGGVSEGEEKRLPKKEWEELQRTTPIEVKNGTFGYISKDGEKYLSGEALTALNLFVTDVMGDEEIQSVLIQIQKKKSAGTKPYSKDRRPGRRSTSYSGAIDDDTLSKLEELKKSLASKKK